MKFLDEPIDPLNKTQLERELQTPIEAINWLAGDGSSRQYYRVHLSHLTPVTLQHKSAVLMQYESSKTFNNESYDWTHLAQQFQHFGIKTPQIFKVLPASNAILIEDCGDITMERHINSIDNKEKREQVLEQSFSKAGSIIVHLLKLPMRQQKLWDSRSFDKDKLLFELDFFYNHYLVNFLKLNLDTRQTKAIREDFNNLAEHLANRNQYCVHRDFHSRNILIKEDHPVLIDFQDARSGPITYDLVSLCYDSYLSIPNQDRHQYRSLITAQIHRELGAKAKMEIEESWKPMLLQRQLKALGSFAFLSLTSKRGNYLKYALPALETLAGLENRNWNFIGGELISLIKNATKLEIGNV